MDLFVVGSCRVFRPLCHAQDNQFVKILNHGAYWFTHSAKDCLRYLDVLGGRRIPAELFDLVVGTGTVTPDSTSISYDLSSSRHVASVIEISTCKLLRYRDWFLHLDQFRIKCKELDLHPDIIAERIETPLGSRGGDFLAEFPMPDFYRALFRETALVMQTHEDLLIDLAEIGRRVPGPMVLVDHFNIPRDDGTLFPDRDRLTKSLRQYAREYGAQLYETGPAIEEHGQKRALVDVNHYADEFRPVVASRLLSVARQAARTGRAKLAAAS